MKKNYFVLATCFFAIILWSCNGNDTTSTTTTDSSNNSATMSTDTSTNMNKTDNTMTNTNTMTAANVDPMDKAFMMKAAMGSMMEVESGKMAQQNAMHQRVKDFGAMLERDHSAAINELMSLATSKGITLSQDSMMMKNKPMMDKMSKMTGKSFESHFINDMIADHKKDIAEFEKASNNAKDPDLKAWAGKTLPTLKMHLDSIQAISKMKM